jgi:hypothetical protein
MINPTIATTITMTTTFGSLKLWLPTTSAAAILRCAVASASTGRVSLPGPPSIQPMQNPSAMNRSPASIPRVPKTWRTLSKFTTVISTIKRMRLTLESQSSGGFTQSAIAEARVRRSVDRAQKRLNFTFDKCRRFAFGPRKSLGFDFPGRIHGQYAFFGQPGKQHPDGSHVLLTVGGAARRCRISIYAATVIGSMSSRS